MKGIKRIQKERFEKKTIVFADDTHKDRWMEAVGCKDALHVEKIFLSLTLYAPPSSQVMLLPFLTEK